MLLSIADRSLHPLCSSLGETVEVHFNTLNITAQLELDHVMPQGTLYTYIMVAVTAN